MHVREWTKNNLREGLQSHGSNTQRRCRVCSARGVKCCVKSVCVECDVALCVDRNCFMDYHTKAKL